MKAYQFKSNQYANEKAQELWDQIHREVAAKQKPVDDYPLPESRPSLKRGADRGCRRNVYRPAAFNPDRLCRSGEVPSAPWIAAEAKRTGITSNAVWYRIRHGGYPHVTVRRFNMAYIFLTIGKPPAMLPAFSKSRSGLSVKTLGAAKYQKQWRQLKKEAA